MQFLNRRFFIYGDVVKILALKIISKKYLYLLKCGKLEICKQKDCFLSFDAVISFHSKQNLILSTIHIQHIQHKLDSYVCLGILHENRNKRRGVPLIYRKR